MKLLVKLFLTPNLLPQGCVTRRNCLARFISWGAKTQNILTSVPEALRRPSTSTCIRPVVLYTKPACWTKANMIKSSSSNNKCNWLTNTPFTLLRAPHNLFCYLDDKIAPGKMRKGDRSSTHDAFAPKKPPPPSKITSVTKIFTRLRRFPLQFVGILRAI